MGYHKNIGPDRWPAQSVITGKRVVVIFNFDLSFQLEGTLVRDDTEEPDISIIMLDNGKALLTTECQFRLKDD